MKLLCKLFGHKWEYIGTLSNGEYQRYKERCERCDKVVIATFATKNPYVINRSDLDESESMVKEEYKNE
ncbi:DUF1660 domain-containing protein [Lactococcus phage 949]|uniref:Phage protein n=1 Tax=Lactococcus phage 949 TaxID=881953 RepID=E0YIV9_9CAUD|nr:DUF1660 domain-containing protein [Lactococcus phage 949]ADM73630.1 hypothetical protein [Lactococcus phage 949]